MIRTSAAMRRLVAGVTALALTRTSVAGAQTTIAPDPPGHFLTRPAVSMASLRQRCLELGDETYAQDVPQVGMCTAHDVTSLGIVGGKRWYSMLVDRRWLLAEPGGSRADTAAESELVLFSSNATPAAARDTLLAPLWHYRFEPEMLRSVTPEVVAADGGVLVSIDECVNGTGGCAQGFLLLRGSLWRFVRLSFLDSLNHRYPGSINHGYHVDVRTLRGSAAVYSPTDANCCPSRVAEFRLRLHGDALEIVALKVRPVD